LDPRAVSGRENYWCERDRATLALVETPWTALRQRAPSLEPLSPHIHHRLQAKLALHLGRPGLAVVLACAAVAVAVDERRHGLVELAAAARACRVRALVEGARAPGTVWVLTPPELAEPSRALGLFSAVLELAVASLARMGAVVFAVAVAGRHPARQEATDRAQEPHGIESKR